MKVFKSYTIQSNSEELMALLSMYAFESFEEHDGYMIGYIAEDECDEETQKGIKTYMDKYKADFEIKTIQPQNWNALWESSFEPVIVDDFCIVRADFHNPVDDITHDIIINPKMAFGTGHHETTYMMMSAMEKIDHNGKYVFDYGCGTGVLAILASKLGAAFIDAIDIEEESFINTKENSSINNVSNINAACATLETFDKKTYDIILANINRNVLLASAAELYNRLSELGTILLSGILEDDESLVIDAYTKAGFEVVEVSSRGYWKCFQLKK